MPRSARYASAAEKQAAYRARRKREQSEAPEVRPAAEPESEAPTSLSSRPITDTHEAAKVALGIDPEEHARRVAALVEKNAYVAAELAVTKHQIDTQGQKDPEGKRMSRCEAYANWRWEGFLNGTVASL